MPKAINDTPTSASADAHDFIDLIISITSLSPLLTEYTQQSSIFGIVDLQNKLPYLVVDTYRMWIKIFKLHFN